MTNRSYSVKQIIAIKAKAKQKTELAEQAAKAASRAAFAKRRHFANRAIAAKAAPQAA